MDEKYRHSILIYTAALDLFIQAYREGIITRKEYIEIEKRIAEKTGIPLKSVYRFKIQDIE